MKVVQVKESYFWQQVKQGLESEDTHLTRVENDAGVGIADVTVCCRGVEAWLELKVFHGNFLHFRTSQKIWILKRSAVGGRIVIVARDGDELLIYDAVQVVCSPHTVEKEGKAFRIHRKDLPDPLFSCSKPFNWARVKDLIQNLRQEVSYR